MRAAATVDTEVIRQRILDELSDGQWHTMAKIGKKVDANGKHVPRNILEQTLEELHDEGVLLSGMNKSYRFETTQLMRWRASSSNHVIQTQPYQPRFFGGVLEDDGWVLAGLKPYELVHFRAEPQLSRAALHEEIGGKLADIQIEEGLYRVLTPVLAEGEHPGDALVANIRRLKEEHPEWEITGIRLERNLMRRDKDDLPSRFLDEFVRYYGKFAKVLLRPYMTSVVKHLPEEDDVQQQIYIWVLDAVHRYDATKSIPFAAYLATSLGKWVHNLNRRTYGRALADAELKHARAIAEYKAENGRDPKPEELANILNMDVAASQKEAHVIHTVTNMRNMSTIHDDEHELQIKSQHDVEENLDQMAQKTLVSAAITTAAKQAGGDTPLYGLAALYYTTWAGAKPSKKVMNWTKSPGVQRLMQSIREETRRILERTR